MPLVPVSTALELIADRVPLRVGHNARGTGHGVPYNYDQRVPILLMGYGIKPGQYLESVSPADIAPTFASLCGITLATRDSHVLAEALSIPAVAHKAVQAPASVRSAPKP